MSSLKQKIQDRIARGENFVWLHQKDMNIASGIVEGENNALKGVLGELDEVTKQIREMLVAQDLEHTHPSTEFWKGWNKAIDRVLAVLEGEKK